MSGLMLDSGGDAGASAGKLKGVSVAVVSANDDPDGLGRVRVRLPWKAPHDSYWARIAVPMAGKERGTWFLPEVGDEVLVAADLEDAEHVFVIGGLWNGQEPPPVTNADGKNDIRMIRSRAGHEVVFDDGVRGSIDIHLKDKKRTVRLDPDGIQIKDDSGNSIEIQSTPGNISIKSNLKISIEATTIDIKANASMTLRASGTLTIQGAIVQIN
jgi:uncharacterized protein involved in type VI secretion and phage assembly